MCPAPNGERPPGERTVGAFFNATTTAETGDGTTDVFGGTTGDGGSSYLDVRVSYTDAGLADVWVQDHVAIPPDDAEGCERHATEEDDDPTDEAEECHLRRSPDE